MADELKPCPFCGGPARQYIDDGGQFPQKLVGCAGACEWAIDKATWQSRPLEDALRADLAALKEEVEGSYEAFNEQKDELETARSDATNYYARVVELDADLAAARARIAELEAADRWIPVSENLPPDHEVVWAISVLMYQGLAYFDSDAEQWYWNMNYSSRTEITHWKQRPVPPKSPYWIGIEGV